jgi:hypothetical protein
MVQSPVCTLQTALVSWLCLGDYIGPGLMGQHSCSPLTQLFPNCNWPIGPGYDLQVVPRPGFRPVEPLTGCLLKTWTDTASSQKECRGNHAIFSLLTSSLLCRSRGTSRCRETSRQSTCSLEVRIQKPGLLVHVTAQPVFVCLGYWVIVKKRSKLFLIHPLRLHSPLGCRCSPPRPSRTTLMWYDFLQEK